MPLLNSGRNFLAGAMVGVETTLFNNANSHIAVGDGTAAFAATQTDLQGTNKFRKGMDAGYPTRNGNTATFRATFGADEANFAWQEWAVTNAPSGGTAINRVVEYNGTKQQGQTWIFEVDLTINIGS